MSVERVEMAAQIQSLDESRAVKVVRCEAMQALDRRMDNARQCSAWLIELGVKVRGVSVDHQAAVVKVTASPLVTRLFAGNCAWRKRRQQGAVTIFTWFAVRNGAHIEWEERQCRG